MTRPRVRLGLCEPIVSHRYLLLGILGAIWTLSDVVVIGQYVDYWAHQTWSASLDILIGLLEIMAFATIWLICQLWATMAGPRSASMKGAS